MRVIATAGHVDHGKSTLLRALTGMEPDRWEEERRRGLTLDLGFVWTDGLAFVDVPGHERFIGNMLSGVGPAPAVLFVVAADDGWAVQSEEHLRIVDALGITTGVLAVTRADLADPGPVLAACRERLRGTGLDGIPAIAVSAVRGDGLAELRAALSALPEPEPSPDADVRLWIDRVFTVEGRGTVVTGTLGAGTIRTGDRLMAGREPVRVRGLHSLGTARDEVRGPARVAVNLRGAATPRRGDALLTPDRWLEVTQADVRLSPATDVPHHAIWHIGTSATPARIRPLTAPSPRTVRNHPPGASAHDLQNSPRVSVGDVQDHPYGGAVRDLRDRPSGGVARDLQGHPPGVSARDLQDHPPGGSARDLQGHPPGVAARDLQDHSRGVVARDLRDHPPGAAARDVQDSAEASGRDPRDRSPGDLGLGAGNRLLADGAGGRSFGGDAVHVTLDRAYGRESVLDRAYGGDTVRVTLERPLPLRIGDRALLRDPGSRRVWGVTVLDVRPPALRRRGAARRRAEELAALDGFPDGEAELRRRGIARLDELAAMGAPVTAEPVAGAWVADPEHWESLRARLVEVVTAHAEASPHDPGMSAEEVRQALGLPDRSLVDALAERTPLGRSRGRLTAAPPELAPGVERLRRDWAAAPFAAPDAARLAELGLDGRDLAAAEAAGHLVRLAPGVVLPTGAPERALTVLSGLAQPFTAADARKALGTSRRVVIPLLEHLDRTGATRRAEDGSRRIAGTGRPER
ncbi:selenocysteine-specific translation elongation factor [Nonomuraea harbinensis]|uniref:SelB C-terminal domain-containing protein n=1 Tax=Nonomuraea harbinensis TaxID=1286938 RepID=A0ABW1BS62_9ACTN|nr:selenocysteine-specific translation elongation factor [Nonomuraea harbinensis]